ncbi:lipid-A-disaccharide synthase [Thalassoglobus polymorphus]|uniref:Lipid-A-disaccharide synthase n=1 Tax=Thalassoglobus polymorphus TaxID=2527994 RepID=A0A517QRL0_9PLAN|nr:lipid-A-disaccharide synthase [Thalassoglobus polymorphus]QDT34248.1 Glycosyl transferase [Thalassoglobus polymorphus]
MHVFLSVGEPSGDQHAAELMREFSRRIPDARFSGFGGPEMQAEGFDCLYQLTDLAVMGIGQVLPLIRKFYGLVQDAKEYLRLQKPDAVVLVDFPGFNWWIARAAKEIGIPVYYYCPPQLWAWAPWRIRKVHRFVDCVLSVLPFEAEWYKKHGVDVEYVGHPFFDEVAEHPLDNRTLAKMASDDLQTIGILPGSRKQEVLRNFPVMLDVMTALYEKHPNIQFQVACYKQWHFDKCSELLNEYGAQLPINLHLNKTAEVIEAADFCLIVSGSVSLELLARKTPAIVMYRGTLMTCILCKALLTVDYMSLPNLIANRAIMPEYPLVRQKSGHIDRMTAELDEWISHPEKVEETRKQLTVIAKAIVETGGVQRAAEVLVNRLSNTDSTTHAVKNRAA